MTAFRRMTALRTSNLSGRLFSSGLTKRLSADSAELSQVCACACCARVWNMLYSLPLSDLSMKLGYPRAKYIYNVSAGLVHNFMEGATKAGCKTLAEPTDWLVKHCATFRSQQRFHCISYKALGD